MNFFKRVEGVFFSPKQTFAALAEKPVWVDVLIIILVAFVAYSLIIMPTMRSEQLQMTKDSSKLKERIGEERFNRQVQRLENPPSTFEYISMVVAGPAVMVVALLIQSLILIMLGRFVSTQGTFKQLFAALIHANLVNAVLGNAVRLILTLTRKSVMQVSTGLAVFFPKLEVTSKAYVILSQVDFFQLWLFGILAFGLAAIFKISLRKALFLSYTVWFLKAVFNIAYILLSLSFVQ